MYFIVYFQFSIWQQQQQRLVPESARLWNLIIIPALPFQLYHFTSDNVYFLSSQNTGLLVVVRCTPLSSGVATNDSAVILRERDTAKLNERSRIVGRNRINNSAWPRQNRIWYYWRIKSPLRTQYMEISTSSWASSSSSSVPWKLLSLVLTFGHHYGVLLCSIFNSSINIYIDVLLYNKIGNDRAGEFIGMTYSVQRRSNISVRGCWRKLLSFDHYHHYSYVYLTLGQIFSLSNYYCLPINDVF